MSQWSFHKDIHKVCKECHVVCILKRNLLVPPCSLFPQQLPYLLFHPEWEMNFRLCFINCTDKQLPVRQSASPTSRSKIYQDKVNLAIKSAVDIHIHKRMNPRVRGDPVTSNLVPSPATHSIQFLVRHKKYRAVMRRLQWNLKNARWCCWKPFHFWCSMSFFL